MNKVCAFFKENRRLSCSMALVGAVIAVAVFAPVLAPHDPLAAVMSKALQGPSWEYPCGTDQLGRCILSRIIYGTRASLKMSLILVSIVFSFGTVMGILAAYFSGIVDAVVMRISDMMISFPGIVLAIAIAGMLGPSMFNTVLALAVVSWSKYARLSRSLTLKMKNQDYVAAAKITGAKHWHILTTYVLPIVIPTMIVTAAMDIGTMMLELSALSFLGLGAQPPTPEWGAMLNEGRKYLQTASWLMIFPGIAIFLVVMAFNLLGDALRDVLDTRQ